MADDHNYNLLNVQETKELYQFYQSFIIVNQDQFIIVLRYRFTISNQRIDTKIILLAEYYI